MEFKRGQLIVMLSPFTETEIYGNVSFALSELLTVTIKTAGHLKSGWDILCLVIDDTEIYEFYSKIVEMEGYSIIITCPEKAGLSAVEKRKFNRVDCEIGFVGRPMLIDNVSVAKTAKAFSGKIRNLSAGGVLVETGMEIPLQAVFSFKLKVNYFIDCLAVVRRASANKDGGCFQLGCEFMNMNIENVKAISLYTFKEQLKKKRQELYNSIFK